MVSIPNEILDSQISDIDIDEISNKYLTNWKRLRSVLGLTRAHEESICTRNLEGQRREFLYKWNELKGDSATYRSLINAAETVQNKNLADNIRRLLSKRLHKLVPSTMSCMCFRPSVVSHYQSLPRLSSTTSVPQQPHPFSHRPKGRHHPYLSLPHRRRSKSFSYPTSSPTQDTIPITTNLDDLPGLRQDNRNVAEEASKLQLQFLRLRVRTQIKFTKMESKNEDFLFEFSLLLTNLRLSAKFKHLTFLETEEQSIMEARKVSMIFQILKNHWNSRDYGLLEHLINVFGDVELRKMMIEYKRDIETFERRTTVQQYQVARRTIEFPDNYSVVSAKLNKDPSVCTLWEVRCFVESLRNSASLEEYAGLMVGEDMSSVLVTLALPHHGILLLKHMHAIQGNDFWVSHHVTSVIIDDIEILQHVTNDEEVSENITEWLIYGKEESLLLQSRSEFVCGGISAQYLKSDGTALYLNSEWEALPNITEIT